MSVPALAVIAKAPEAGRSKTRLCPPLTPEGAAALAQAALEDTLAAVAASRAGRRVVVLDGEPGDWLPPGFEVIPQRGGGFDERLAGAFSDVDGSCLVIAMDTPQVTSQQLDDALAALSKPLTDAVFGAADDGGYWAIGLTRPDPAVFLGVPMSRDDTGERQRRRLSELGLSVTELPPLRDVDTIEDALAVAADGPDTRFAAMLAELIGTEGRSRRFAPAPHHTVSKSSSTASA